VIIQTKLRQQFHKCNLKHDKSMKKNRMMLCRYRYSWEKTLRIMKISLVLLVFCGLTLSASPTKGQNQSVTIEVENATLLDVFRQIEESSNLGFFFKNDQLDLQKRYSVNFENASVEEVLSQVLDREEYDYQIVGENVVVTQRNSENSLAQQQSTVSGMVTDDNGEPVPGVTVMVKGTTTGTITDVEGHYELSNVPENATLVFSFVGMKTREVVVESDVINVQLEEAVIGLDEIVAIGYGSMKKADLTSSVATVKADDFVKGSVKDPGQLIQGKVAGLTIVNPSGDPTSNSEIILRGNTTLVGASISPLVLIDGVPGDMNTVAPQDIESIDVLKDGSAAAIYGTRGTNGVILITTRRASGHFESSVEVSSYVNVQTLSRKPNLSTAADFREQIEAGFRNANTDLGHSTDWLDEITRSPVSHVHNVTFRGGDEETNYLLNVNYDSAKGIFLKSYSDDFKGRADINHNMFDNKLKLNLSILGSDRKLNGFNGYNYRQTLIQNPTAPVEDEDGEWFQQLTKFEYENPVSNLMESDALTREHLTRFNSNIIFNPIKQLKLSSVLSYSKWNQNGGYSESKQHVTCKKRNR
jgi:TonB-linked SusC/RagA family outer membrane protein